MRSTVLDIVEGAYDVDVDDQTWLVQANDRFVKQFRNAVAPGGYVITKTAEGPPRFHSAYLGGVEDAMTVFEPMHEDMHPSLAEAVFLNGTVCATFSELWATVPREVREVGDTSPLLDYIRERGGDDLLFASNFDHTGTGVLLGAVVSGAKLTDRERAVHRKTVVHMAAGLRLRRSLGGADTLDEADAIFEADGRLANAKDRAADGVMRERLREAVTRVDRARTRGVRSEALEALELWQGLVEGRWSLIDRHDTDGRRYYVAIANPHSGVDARRLDELESRVVAQVAVGEPNGVIAYSLGLSESMVAKHLASAMRKLGATSRMDLVRLGQTLGTASWSSRAASS